MNETNETELMACGEKTLEEAYFHICNSGMTVKIKEVIRSNNYTYKMDIDLHAFGTTVKSSIDLRNTEFVTWLGEALLRTSSKMKEGSSWGKMKLHDKKYREDHKNKMDSLKDKIAQNS